MHFIALLSTFATTFLVAQASIVGLVERREPGIIGTTMSQVVDTGATVIDFIDYYAVYGFSTSVPQIHNSVGNLTGALDLVALGISNTPRNGTVAVPIIIDPSTVPTAGTYVLTLGVTSFNPNINSYKFQLFSTNVTIISM